MCLLCLQVYNLGTGKGYSVLQMVKAMEKASEREVSVLRVPAMHVKKLNTAILPFESNLEKEAVIRYSVLSCWVKEWESKE